MSLAGMACIIGAGVVANLLRERGRPDDAAPTET
jgi:hypothetical protein